MSYCITSDSTADITEARMRELNVPFAPMRMQLEGKEYEDHMRAEETARLYARMREGAIARTTQINPEAFINLWDSILRAGQDVIYIGFSSAMSGTYNSARLAADILRNRYPARTILTVDSLCGCTGLGMLIEYAASLRDEGLSLASLQEKVLAICGRVHHWFTVDSLSYLKRGGRISSTAAALATLLQIKPILTLNETGHLVAASQVKGRRNSMRRLVEICMEKIDLTLTRFISISHAECPADAQLLKDMVSAQLPQMPIQIHTVGATIGSHAGPGALALFFIGKEGTRLAAQT